MSSFTRILTRPEVIASVVVILGAAVVSLRMTNPKRWRSRQAKAPGAVSTPAGASGPATPGPAGAAPPAYATAGYAPPTAVFEVGSSHPDVRFSDVAGLDEAIAELREVTEYLADPQRFQALGAELPRGILLFGLPGCGKTLLARALAGETGVPFYFVSAASFVEQFVGLGAARVRQLFEKAKSTAPSIVFIDELDAIGRSRDAEVGGGREFDHTLNQLLVELDGFPGSSGVLVLGATNRPELIDSALLRPGRFDRRIMVDRPDRDGRERILRLHAARRLMSRRVDWAEVASHTAGLTAAELANIVNEASLLAARRYHGKVTPEDVDEATARVLSGNRTSRLMDDDEKQLVAVHEAGHAVLSILLRGVKPPSRISIVARSGSFAKSAWSTDDDRGILTKRQLMAQLIVLLAGRAAEMNTFGEPSTRAEDDLDHAAALAHRMVERWAMTGRFELAGSRRDAVGTHLAGSLSGTEVRELLARSEQAARTILADKKDVLSLIAETLAERESLTAAEVEELASRGRRATPGAGLEPVSPARAW